MTRRVLLNVDRPSFSGALLHDICERNSVDLGNLVIVTSLQELKKQQLPGDGAYDVVVSVSAAASHDIQSLGVLTALAKPGAVLIVQQPDSPATSGQDLQQLVLLAGLVSCSSTTAYSLEPLPSRSSAGSVSQTAVEARKPEWAVGAQHPIKRKAKASSKAVTPVQTPTVAASKSATAWGAVALNGKAELIDDEELLTEADLARPDVPVVDCSTSRKACKDCSCGRAEAEAAGEPAPKLTQQMLDNPGAAGGCGSCALGDAFRCASCPYRGLPTFEMGKKIELPVGFLAEDF